MENSNNVILVYVLYFGRYLLSFHGEEYYYILYSHLVFLVLNGDIYLDNYRIVINLLCNNRDRQYMKYFISHITK